MNTEMIFWATLLLISSIITSLTAKVAANKLEPQTAPIFSSLWLLLLFLLTIPLFKTTWLEIPKHINNHTWVIIPIIMKGLLIFYAKYVHMKLSKHSLSAGNFILPPALAMSPALLFFFGENINLGQFILSTCLGLLGVSFFFFGHIAKLNKQSKKHFIILVLLCLGLILCDFFIIHNSNWILLVFGSTLIQVAYILIKKYPLHIWKQALFSWQGLLAGLSFAFCEFIGFYQMATITPVTIIVAIKAAAIPFIQLATVYFWKEGQWHVQLLWGLATTILLILLAFQ